jgi:hypothetical protein
MGKIIVIIRRILMLKKKMRNPWKPEIKLVIPRVFYQYCKKCEIEYKNFPMWKYKEYHYSGMGDIDAFDRYLCLDCSHVKEDAIKFFMNKNEYKCFRDIENKIEKLSKEK